MDVSESSLVGLPLGGRPQPPSYALSGPSATTGPPPCPCRDESFLFNLFAVRGGRSPALAGRLQALRSLRRALLETLEAVISGASAGGAPPGSQRRYTGGPAPLMPRPLRRICARGVVLGGVLARSCGGGRQLLDPAPAARGTRRPTDRRPRRDAVCRGRAS